MIEGMEDMDHKIAFLDLLNRFDSKSKYKIKSKDFHPLSFVLNYTDYNYSTDEIRFLNYVPASKNEIRLVLEKYL